MVWQKTFAVISVFTFKGLKLTGLMEITFEVGNFTKNGNRIIGSNLNSLKSLAAIWLV